MFHEDYYSNPPVEYPFIKKYSHRHTKYTALNKVSRYDQGYRGTYLGFTLFDVPDYYSLVRFEYISHYGRVNYRITRGGCSLQYFITLNGVCTKIAKKPPHGFHWWKELMLREYGQIIKVTPEMLRNEIIKGLKTVDPENKMNIDISKLK